MKELEDAIHITMPNYIKLMDFKGLQSAFGVLAYSCLVFSCKMKWNTKAIFFFFYLPKISLVFNSGRKLVNNFE